MSLWPPGVVQRLTSQTPPQHVVQHPRSPVVGWQHQYQQQGFQHTAQQQQQQLCLLLEQQQQLHYQQLQPDQHWEALQYVLQQQGPVQQQAYASPTRGCIVVAAAAVPKQQSTAEAAAASFIACLPPAAFDNITELVALQHEVVQWPQDKQPKQGYISKAKLRKLTMSELRAELSRLQVSDTQGLKEDLINILLAHLLYRSIAAAAAAASAAGNGDAAAAPMHVSLASRGELMLHRVSVVLYRAVQQQQTVPVQRVGLQVLTACQVSDLQAALQAVWPLVQPISTISRDQLLAGSPADLVYKLLLCLAACADTNSSSFEAVQVAAQSAQPAQVVSRGTAVQQADVQQQQQAVQSTKVDLRQQIQDALSQVPQMPPPRQQQQQQSPVPKQSQPPAQQPQGSTSSSTRNTLQQLQQQRQPPEDVPAGYTQPQGPIVVSGTMPPYDAQEAARVAAAVGVNLDDLPPLAQQARGHVYDVDWMTGFTEQEKDYVLKANRSGLTLTLVGGAVDGGLTGDSSARCISLLRERDAWLFDAGEDTQRLLMWLEHLRPSKLHRIVVSRQSPDALLGLPGILCVIGSAREKGHEKADIPVHVFAPEGTCEFLNTMYDCGNTFLEMPVVVHEFVHHAVSQDEMAPQLFNNRSKLWRVLVPPDQLNPDGFVDARLENFSPLQGRARTMSGSRSAGGVLAKNPRAGYRPLPTPPPGDPILRDLARSDMTWTIQADEAAMLTAVAVEAEDLTWAMVWKEADKQGNLSVPRCLALGITNGELYGVAKTGEAVPNDDGITIPAYMVCTQDKPGRKLVVLPACESAAAVGRYAADADVMFADAGAARDAAPSAPLGAAVGVCAREWGVRTLVTTAMPQSDDVRRAENLENNWFNPGWRKRRLGHVGNSYMSSRESDSDDESDQHKQQQQQRVSEQQSPEQSEGKLSDQQGEQEQELPIPGSWQEAAQTDPILGSFLQAVAQKYDSGLLIPGRDCMSLIVEENSGKALPAVLDMNAKEADARATSLVMCIDALDPSNRQQQGGAQQWQQGGGGYKGRGGGGQQQRRSGQRSGQYQQRQGGQQRQQQWQQRGERSMAR